MVREMGLEPTRLWLDTGTSSLPVYLFQHSRIGLPSRRSVIIEHIHRFVNSFFMRIVFRSDFFSAYRSSSLSSAVSEAFSAGRSSLLSA